MGRGSGQEVLLGAVEQSDKRLIAAGRKSAFFNDVTPAKSTASQIQLYTQEYLGSLNCAQCVRKKEDQNIRSRMDLRGVGEMGAGYDQNT